MTDDKLPVGSPRHDDGPSINCDHVPSLRGGPKTVIIRGARESEWVEGTSVSRKAWR